MKQVKKKLSTYKRKVHIGEQEWTYRVVSSYALAKDQVKVCSPDRTKKWNLGVGNLGNGDYRDINAMTPAHVKRLIAKRILGRDIPR